MMANHIALNDAVERILLVYRNPTHMNWMRGGILKGLAVTVIGGFPQALVTIPGMHGMKAIADGVRHGDSHSLGQFCRLGFGFLLILSGGIYTVRHHRWEWLVALVGFSILPVVWNNVYGYQKFYMLFPLLAAHVIARVTPRASLPIVGLLAFSNINALIADVRAGREKYTARTVQYQHASQTSRWITSGWGPDFSYLWPGRDCGMLKSLAKPSAAKSVEILRAERTGEFIECVREAFCSGQPVWTDDWIQVNAASIGDIATFHGLSSSFLDRTWWRGAQDGEAVDRDPLHSLYTYAPERRVQICSSLREEIGH